MADLNNAFNIASMKQMLSQYQEMQKNLNKQLLKQGTGFGQSQAAGQNLEKNFLEQLGQVIPGLNLQQAREQQAQDQWSQQFGLQQQGQKFNQQQALNSMMEQIRQFNEQSAIQKRQNDINEMVAQGQMEANRYQQGQGQWMNLLGSLLGMGLMPGNMQSGFLLNLLGGLGGNKKTP